MRIPPPPLFFFTFSFDNSLIDTTLCLLLLTFSKLKLNSLFLKEICRQFGIIKEWGGEGRAGIILGFYKPHIYGICRREPVWPSSKALGW